jgi:hypothetical protein
MEAKTARNKRILAAFVKGTSIYKIAKAHKLSWPRTKRIILEQQQRESR